ncbi:hypothetical protein BY458DRAFT_527747 [Sporodiniella umbellata]|nr:hypothetical protein BY458DRAFT_527747 [Sporodiniella umbellata]
MVNFEVLLKTRLEENDTIEAIHNTLSEYYTIGISPDFCSTLFIPLIEHFVGNKQLEKHSEIYSLILTQLYEYTEQNFFNGDPHQIFLDAIHLLRDVRNAMLNELETQWGSVYPKALKPPIQLQLVTMLTRACTWMTKESFHGTFGWTELPYLFEISSRAVQRQPYLLIVCDYVKVCSQSPPDEMDELMIENTLICLLQAGNDDFLVSAANVVISMRLEIKLCDPFGLFNLLPSLIHTELTKEKAQLLLDACYVLNRNGISFRHINPFLEAVSHHPILLSDLDIPMKMLNYLKQLYPSIN